MKRLVGLQFLVATVVAVAFRWEVFLAQVYSFPTYEISALAAFKRAAFKDPLSALADWNPLDGSPCNWTGVACSVNRDWSSLKGFLTPELRYLGCLQELHLRNNLLLDLSVNRLIGPIPPMLGELTVVTKLDLHSNGLTGMIPPELGKLKNLLELRLDRDKLEGQIPGVTMSNFSATLHAM
ncbi:hypothetical protein ZIOFF_022559 [Zingiber officinale]|uniref:Leucine-rich repeat-containing N-terminal plant-type domain-containing protein n=1 Tax=Zingiber officinale TaxID=94328 RepID=A0A8J5HKV1_ZINOF|nr:hypothetical protein ZIOFF_022559 [Zingiber officinale]